MATSTVQVQRASMEVCCGARGDVEAFEGINPAEVLFDQPLVRGQTSYNLCPSVSVVAPGSEACCPPCMGSISMKEQMACVTVGTAGETESRNKTVCQASAWCRCTLVQMEQFTVVDCVP